MVGRLEGKVAIITGAARGMGETHARRFVEEGARVVLTDVLPGGAAVACALGDTACFVHHDVREEAGWAAVVTEAEARFGPVSVLVNNAAVSIEAPIADYPVEDFRRSVEINQVGAFLGMKAAFPSMQRAGGGSIVNISSLAGLVGGPNAIAYAATKFALRGMSKVAAIEWGRDRIRVNTVHPGAIRTPMLMDHPNFADLQRFGTMSPAGRLGEPEEISSLVIYLASDEASFCTGAEFVADGGATAM